MTRSISPQEAARQLAAGEALLIDVREPAEFAASHVPLAVSMPLSGLPKLLAGLPRDRTLIFQCQSGMRSVQACALAATQGDSVSLGGGIAAWQAAGLPVVGNAGPRFSIFRQVQMIVGALVALLVAAGFAGLTAAFAIAGIMGAMLAFAGATGWCGLAMLLARMPWNRTVQAS